MLVKETISFQRGGDPKDTLGIGKRFLIEKWLEKMHVKYYKINDDMTIDSIESCFIISDDKNIGIFPEYIQFNRINGHFRCNDCGLTSLRGCPYYVDESFFCSRNYLTSMKYAPKIVKEQFWCTQNVGKKITKSEILKYCFVEGGIYL